MGGVSLLYSEIINGMPNHTPQQHPLNVIEHELNPLLTSYPAPLTSHLHMTLSLSHDVIVDDKAKASTIHSHVVVDVYEENI